MLSTGRSDSTGHLTISSSRPTRIPREGSSLLGTSYIDPSILQSPTLKLVLVSEGTTSCVRDFDHQG